MGFTKKLMDHPKMSFNQIEEKKLELEMKIKVMTEKVS